MDYNISSQGTAYIPKIIRECIWRQNRFNGTIASPSYPLSYGPNQECTYLLKAPMDQVISLKIEDMQMEVTDICTNDYVEVRDGDADGQLLAKYCGRPLDLGHRVTSLSRNMWVKFVSNGKSEFRGFLATYRAVKTLHRYTGQEPRPVTSEVRLVAMKRGQKQTFNCSSRYNQTGKTIWMKEHLLLKVGHGSSLPGVTVFENGSLIINEMSPGLKGIYVCTLALPMELQIFNIHLSQEQTTQEERCGINFDVIPKSITVEEGTMGSLRCSTDNKIPLAAEGILWKKDNQEISITAHPRAQKVLPGLLLLYPVEQEDAGIYTCVVTTKDKCVMTIDTVVNVQSVA